VKRGTFTKPNNRIRVFYFYSTCCASSITGGQITVLQKKAKDEKKNQFGAFRLLLQNSPFELDSTGTHRKLKCRILHTRRQPTQKEKKQI
jgi:hypothetical protein